MMKLLTIFALSAAMGLSRGSNSPQFTWLRAQPQPLLKVTFPDGQEDVAVLERYNPIAVGPDEREEDVDRCIFDGYLSEEKDVYVTLTGCPFTGNFDVQFNSMRLSNTMFSITEGVVGAIPSLFDEVEHQVQQSLNAFARDAVNPKGYIIKMKIRYDDNFKTKLGTDAVNTIRKVAAHAQNIWRWPSLPTSLTFDIDSKVENVPGKFDAASDLYTAGLLSTDPKFQSYVYWGFKGNEAESFGTSYASGTCSEDVTQRTVLIEYSKNLRSSVLSFTRELAHNIGIKDDYFDDNIEKNRTDSKGKSCTRVGSVMDIFGKQTKWTTCSGEDITNYINSVTPFCLTAL